MRKWIWVGAIVAVVLVLVWWYAVGARHVRFHYQRQPLSASLGEGFGVYGVSLMMGYSGWTQPSGKAIRYGDHMLIFSWADVPPQSATDESEATAIEPSTPDLDGGS